MLDRVGGWCVYILRCADGTLYTGIAADLKRRLQAHRTGRGARYTRGRLPVRVLYREACANRSEASRREAAIKRLPRRRKLALTRSAAGDAAGRAPSPTRR